ncbi:hypothetical protein D9M71_116230 [compost metagenome]
MSTIGDRLREERERLGFSQTVFAETGGVQKRAQINYEQGERFPGVDYLAAVAKLGVDAQYIVTGERSSSAAQMALPADQQLLLDAYQALTAAKRKALLASLLTGSTPKPRKSGEGISVAGNSNRVAGRDITERK